MQHERIDRYGYRKTRHRGLSYRQLANGSRRYYGFIHTRGRVALASTGERDALAELGELRGRVANGEKLPPRTVRLSETFEAWLPAVRAPARPRHGSCTGRQQTTT